MTITATDALLINSILFLAGFILTLFISRKYKSRFEGLYLINLYFLFNSAGVFLIFLLGEKAPILSVVLANILLLLAPTLFVIGLLKFYKRKINYKWIVILFALINVLLLYFTYINEDYVVRSSIVGLCVLLIHASILFILHRNKNKHNTDIELLSVVVIVFVIALIIRGISPLFYEFPTSAIDLEGFVVFSNIVIGITGGFISIGLPSLINNILLDESLESSSSFKAVLRSSPLPLILHTEDGEILYVSEVFTKITGYTLKEIDRVDKWLDKAYDQEREYIKNLIKGLYKKPYTKNDNVSKVRIKDGSLRIWSFHSSYVGIFTDGRNIAMSVATDITESQEKDLELKSLETKNFFLSEANKIAVKLAGLLVWSKTYHKKEEAGKFFVNEKYADLMGWERSVNGMVSYNDFYESICQEEVEQVEEFKKYKKRLHDNEINEYTLSNFRHKNAKTNEDIYLNHHCKVEERYEDGSIKRLGGYNIDITESRKADRVLKFEREKSQKYLDIIGTLVVALDNNGNITLLNKKGCKLLGVTEEEVLGKNWIKEFIPKEEKKEINMIFNDVFEIDKEFTHQNENEIITKSGERRIISWNNSILLDINNNVSGVISSGEDVTETRLYEQRLKEIGYKDALTGLFNRRYYEERLTYIDTKSNYPITIVMGDINGLKLINDAFGHGSGDELLISAAKVIKETCRETDLVARIGGDEFVIVMPKTNDEEAEKIISEIHKKARDIRIESIELSISFGIKTKYVEEEDMQEIYRSAEDLMYREKLLEIPSMRSGAIETILNTLYEKDEKSEIHSRAVSLISERLATAKGMSRQDIAETKTAGLLHDIGKIIIPSAIINKKGTLTAYEYNTIKNHPEIGFRILNSTSDMRSISNIVLCHHERWDGSGYPRGIKGEDIPIKARIITIADAFDAMTSERTYREVLSKKEALEELIANSGTQFDPVLVDVFKENFLDIIKEN